MHRAYTAHSFLVGVILLLVPISAGAVGTQADQKCLKGTQYDYSCDYPNTEKKMVNGKEVRVYCWRGFPCPDVTNNITTPGKCVAELKCEATKPAGQATPEQKDNCVGGVCKPLPVDKPAAETKLSGSIIDQVVNPNPENLEPDAPRSAPPSTTNVNETLDPNKEPTWANWYDTLKKEVKGWWTNDPERTPVPSFEKESITNIKPPEAPSVPEGSIPKGNNPDYLDIPPYEITPLEKQTDPYGKDPETSTGETPSSPSGCDSIMTCAAEYLREVREGKTDVPTVIDKLAGAPRSPEAPTLEELKQLVGSGNPERKVEELITGKKDWIDTERDPRVFEQMPKFAKLACDHIGGCADPDAIAKGWAGTVCQESRCNPNLLNLFKNGDERRYQGLGQNSPDQWERTYMIWDDISENKNLTLEQREFARKMADSIINDEINGYDSRFGKTPDGDLHGLGHYTAYQIENGLGKYANETNPKFLAGAAQLTQLSPGAWNRENGLTPGDIKNLGGNEVRVRVGAVPADAINAITNQPTYNKNFTDGITRQTLALNNPVVTPTQVASYNPSYTPSYTTPTWTNAPTYTAIVESGTPVAPSTPTAIASYDPSPVVSFEPGPAAPAITYEPTPGFTPPSSVDTPVRAASVNPGFVPSNLNGGWTTTDFPTSDVFGTTPTPITMPEIPRLSPITGPHMDPIDWTGVPNVAYGYTPQTAPEFQPSPSNVFLEDNIPAGRPIAADNPFPESGTPGPVETTPMQSPQQPPLNIQPGGERSVILGSNPDAPQPTGNSWLDHDFLYTDEYYRNNPDSLTPAWPHAPQQDIAPLTSVERGPDLASPSERVGITRETFDAWWGDTPWSIAHTEEPRVAVEVPTPTGEPPFTEGPRPIAADNPFPESGTPGPVETTPMQSPQQPPLNIQPGGERSAILASNPDAPQPTSKTPRFVAPTEIDWTQVPNVAYGYTPHSSPRISPPNVFLADNEPVGRGERIVAPPNVFLADNEPMGRGNGPGPQTGIVGISPETPRSQEPTDSEIPNEPYGYTPQRPKVAQPGDSEVFAEKPGQETKPLSILEQLPPYEQGPRLDPFPMPKAQPEPAATPPKKWGEIVGGTRTKFADLGKDIIDTFRTGVWDWPQQERPTPTEQPFDETKIPTPEQVVTYEVPDAQQSVLDQLKREGIEVKTEEPKPPETTAEPKPSTTEPKPTPEPPKPTTPSPEPPKTTMPVPAPPQTTPPPARTTTPAPGPGTTPQPGPGKQPTQPSPSGSTNFGSGLSSALQSLGSIFSNMLGSFMKKLTGQGQQQKPQPQPAQQPTPQPSQPQPSTPTRPTAVVSGTANPPEITKSGSATLYWTALGVTECKLTKPNGEIVGQGTPGGSARVTSVEATTDYSLVCTGAGGATATSSIKLKVR